MSERAPTDLQTLVDLVARLRAPDGCPWDREQRLPDLRAYLLEEAHELAGAIDEGRWEAIAEELGDVLFQTAFIARLAEEAGTFGAGDAIAGVEAKMIARHPHVFGGESLADAEAVRAAWERRKLAREPRRGSLFSRGSAPSLPALLAAYRLTQKAAGVGFDWPDAARCWRRSTRRPPSSARRWGRSPRHPAAAPRPCRPCRRRRRRPRQSCRRRGAGRPPLHPRQPGAQARPRPRGRPGRHQPEVPPPLRPRRGGARRARQEPPPRRPSTRWTSSGRRRRRKPPGRASRRAALRPSRRGR